MPARRTPLISAVLSAALAIAVAVPALAAADDASASGSITWDGEGGADPGRMSSFEVQDGVPGAIGSDQGDHGWYALDKPSGASMRMDVACVRIVADEGWAEFAGTIVEASPPFTVGEVFQVAIVDSGKVGKRGDEIGMKYRDGLDRACRLVLDEIRLGRQGVITRGNIRIRGPR